MNRVNLHLGFAAAIFVALFCLDLAHRTDPFVFAEFAQDCFEWALMSIGAAATSYIALGLRDTKRERQTLTSDLARAKADGDRWRAAARVHSLGLAQDIRAQFAAWRLTAGEADVAILMLKGLSHKEIANLRLSSSATVRQQAVAVYGKSGLASRAELAAYFLEDLFSSPAIRNGTPAAGFSDGPTAAAPPVAHM